LDVEKNMPPQKHQSSIALLLTLYILRIILRVIIRFSLVIRDIKHIFSAVEVIFIVFLAEYAAAEAPDFSY